jgi:hypothetical protein
MKNLRLDLATNERLVNRFVDIGVAQDEALLRDQIGKVNRLFDELQIIEAELKKRSGDQRRLLIELCDHPNMQVRVNAAKATLAVAPESALAALEDIRASHWQPQALNAGMCLWALEQGIFKPT